MGIEEAIIQEVTDKVTKKVTSEVTNKVTLEVTEKVEMQTKINVIQKALAKGKYTIEDIGDLFEVSLEFVQKVKSGEIK